MATDWYRCESWTKDEEQEFFAKLGRARKDGRAQYLRVQAFHLVESGDLRLLEAAESLLNRILTDFPDNRVERSMTLSQLGTIYRIRGNNDRALHYFKQAVGFEKEFPNVISGAHLSFAEVVVEEGRVEFYDEVEGILVTEMEKGGFNFPSQRYISSSVLSIIYASKGDADKAKHYADIAEINAASTTNTLWNPRKRSLGLVEARKGWLDKKVREGLAPQIVITPKRRNMRKIIAAEFMTIDGVIQNEENDGDGFKYGGWFFPYADEVTGAVVQERLAKPMDLLLGRKTFEGWETYWPTHSNFWPNVMTATKYVASNTRESSDWQPSVFLSGDLSEKVSELKQTEGPDIHVMGSADMLQTLFKADLVDALELMIIPVTLGQGKRLFQDGTIPAPFKVTSSQIAPKGIICITYERNGDVKTGSPQIEEDE